MPDGDVIAAVKTAVAALNAALLAAQEAQIEADVYSLSVETMGERVKRQIVSVHLTRSKTEIDVRL